MNSSKKALLVGWDAADWRVIRDLLLQDELPHLSKLIKKGVSGNLSTLYPSLSPMLWTSVATGKRPHKHGIHGFIEPDPCARGVRPITNLSRKTKAFWNILCQNDNKCIVVGWWPSFPAEPLANGAMVSNSFHRDPNNNKSDNWPVHPGTLHPENLADALVKKRIRPSEVNEYIIKEFLPIRNKINRKKDKRPDALSKIIADCSNIHSAGMHLISSQPWDLFAIYYDGIDHFCHGFMRYHPPCQDWISKKDFELYKHVVAAGYKFHDKMLGELLTSIDDDTTVIIMSDHGFHQHRLRSKLIPVEPTGPVIEHRDYGIFVMCGPQINSATTINGASILDVTPTLLTLFNLPIGQDMDGKPLLSAWREASAVQSIPSWDLIPGIDGTHPPGSHLSTQDSQEALRQLESLGYIEPLPANSDEASVRAQRELDYNLACSYLDAQMSQAAANIFLRLWSSNPTEERFGTKLFICQLRLEQVLAARATFQQLKHCAQKAIGESKTTLEQSFKHSKTRRKKVLTLRKEGSGKEVKQDVYEVKYNHIALQQMEALLLLSEEKPQSALKILKRIENKKCNDISICFQKGQCYLLLKHFRKAKLAFLKALSIDNENAANHLGLAFTYLAQKNSCGAIDSALASLELNYYSPMSHYILGIALHRSGFISQSMEALKVCLQQNSSFFLAHKRIAYIYQHRIGDAKRAQQHIKQYQSIKAILKPPNERRATAKRIRLEDEIASFKLFSIANKSNFDESLLSPARSDVSFVTVVSGLPRSGTSMMMQLLSAGGMPTLHDNHRCADIDNPLGYYEFAPAAKIGMDSSWLKYAQGRAFKLVAQLLPFLPRNYDYRIILMERSLDEIVASQKIMLNRHNLKGAQLSPSKLKLVYRDQFNSVVSEAMGRGFPLLRVSYKNAVENPSLVYQQLAKFLNLHLDQEAMVASIKPSLYRHKFHSFK